MPTRLARSRTNWLSVLIVSALAVFAGMASKAFSQTVTLEAAPTTGMSPLSVALTWSATGFPAEAACAASGHTLWTGAKPLSGTQTISLKGGLHTLVLDCSATTGSAVLNWVAATQNTDSTAISPTPPGATAGFKLYTATQSSALATSTPIVVSDPAARTYTVSGLPVGTNYFAARQFNTEGFESAFTGAVNTVIVVPSIRGQVAVTVNVVPKPPVLTVTAVTAWDVQLHPIEGTRLARVVGTVPVGTECVGEPIVQTFGGTYYEVALETVSLSKTPKTVVVAQCDLT